MNKLKFNSRIIYAFFFVLILIIEVLIALYVKDDYIRPYGGDVLVTALICCFARIFILKNPYIPLLVFLFALAVEIGQYFGLVYLIGLGDIEFFRILIGTGFSFIDIICYAVGCLLFYLCEKAIERKE